MSLPGQVLVPVPPDIDPTIAIMQSQRGGAPTVLTEGRLISGRNSLICAGALLIFTLGFGLFSASNSSEEAIAILERLSAKAESAQRIAPETRSVLAELLAKPHFDCDRLKCGPRLQERYRLARAKLTNAIAGAPIQATATADIRD